MATATNLSKHGVSSKAGASPDGASGDHAILRAFDVVYRFLASVKLAVICILTLALVLTGATFFESSYGIPAGRQYFYQNPLFSILLAFLACNIFCAATIRVPWKKRQTGFVVTHVGLLVVLSGAFVSLRYADEGRLGMIEGTSSHELVRDEHAVVRVQKLDAETGKVTNSYDMRFVPGAFAWSSESLAALSKDPSYRWKVGVARLTLGFMLIGLIGFVSYWAFKRPSWVTPATGSAFTAVLFGLTAGLGVYNALLPSGPRRDVLSDASDPFTLAVTDFLPSSGLREIRAEPDRDGRPVVKIALMATPPGAKESVDTFDGGGWFDVTEPMIPRRLGHARPRPLVSLVPDRPRPGRRGTSSTTSCTLPRIRSRIAPPGSIIGTRPKKPRSYEWVLGEALTRGDRHLAGERPGRQIRRLRGHRPGR